jgi:hypothetical protein
MSCTQPDPPFAPIVRTLVERWPQRFAAGGCRQRAEAARDALQTSGYPARVSERLPAEAFGYHVRDVWVYADGSHSFDEQVPDLPSGVKVTQADGHFVCLLDWEGTTWLIDLAAGQFGVEQHPVIRPLSSPHI